MALWAGRFKKEINENVNAFNSSISFDARMYKHDIMGSIAHASMLCKQGIIDEKSLKDILTGLDEILNDLETGKLLFDPNAEDIHMFIESELTKKYPVSGKKLHTARSRNDQVALDLRLYTRDEMKDVKQMLIDLINVIIEQSLQHTETIMCGYTHLQRAQPITFAHHLMAYAQMFYRDITRIDDCYERMNVSPLGSGALATTTYPIDREFVAQQLGMSGICENSLDGVSDRDYAIEFANALALIMMHLSRFSEEMILWCSWEFKYIELDDAYATGSSIMPQKKNPDIAELVRGKSARVINHVSSLLTMMKGLPLAYNKDMQEDKEMYFDALNTTKGCLQLLSDMLKSTTFNKDKMKKSATGGFTNATDAADYLVNKGVPFRDAHGIIGQLVLYAISQNKDLDELSLEEFKNISDVFEEDVYQAIDVNTCVNKRNTIGACGQEMMKKVIALNEEYLKQF